MSTSEGLTLRRLTYLAASIKGFGAVPVYLNILLPVIGFWEFVRLRWSVFTIIVVAVISFNSFSIIASSGYSPIPLLRLVQLIFCVFYSQSIARTGFRPSPLDAVVLSCLGVLSIILQFALGNTGSRGDLSDSSVVRFSPLELDYNMASQLFATLTAILLGLGYWRSSILTAIIAMTTVSRSALIAILMAVVTSMLKSTQIVRFIIVYGVTIVTFSYPLSFGYYASTLSKEKAYEFNKTSSERLTYHTAYIDMGWNYPLTGVGFFVGPELVEDYITQKRLDENKVLEQHSFYLQVWSEFGIVTYCFMLVLWIYLGHIAISRNIEFAPAFVAITILAAFNNFATTWSLWTVIGLLHQSSDRDQLH